MQNRFIDWLYNFVIEFTVLLIEQIKTINKKWVLGDNSRSISLIYQGSVLVSMTTNSILFSITIITKIDKQTKVE